ncbi:hypothetical protein COCSADRAFT_32973 [Bipolaris sorokiniana ND90Pr]|uniref:Uncharacterized protein n=1 Tax=Cochliobolus sativus (strain ND90Pr / ATCC 201652) TaxID=665912 RepID=M2RN06_COCSN|nr:uncharacterized protein COCSADRAFT_32973 [Bipolaris sorokiniana ND90Pr]EMD68014.1 hypothetical protein COCSADRAFT_32973 [Bipolaris sorokiniana ND90Pr]
MKVTVDAGMDGNDVSMMCYTHLPGNLRDSLHEKLQTDPCTYYSLLLHSTIFYATDQSVPQASDRAGILCRQDEWVLRLIATWSSFAGDTSRARRHADFGTVPRSWFLFLPTTHTMPVYRDAGRAGLCLHEIAWVPYICHTHVRLQRHGGP